MYIDTNTLYKTIVVYQKLQDFVQETEIEILPFSDIPTFRYGEDPDYNFHRLFYDDKNPQKDENGKIYYNLVADKDICYLPERHGIISCYNTIADCFEPRVRLTKSWDEGNEDGFDEEDYHTNFAYIELHPIYLFKSDVDFENKFDDRPFELLMHNGCLWTDACDMYNEFVVYRNCKYIGDEE